MKRTKKLVAFALAAALSLGLTACGGNDAAGSDSKGGDNSDGVVYRELYENEMTSLNYLVVATQNEFKASGNFVDTLISYDQYGQPYGSLATSWTTSPDGLTWTFTLRDGVKWYTWDDKEYADVKAQDFVDALEYLLTPSNDSKTSDLVTSVIKNAQAFYSGQISDFSQVGVKALDDKTVQYTLEAPTPYFLSMLSYVCFMPANGDFLAECGSKFGTSKDTLLYCGAYRCQEFNPQENQVWAKNENYWNASHVYIDQIERTYNAEASKIAPQMYLDGTIDQAKVPSDLLSDDSYKDIVRPTRLSAYTYWWLFNFDPHFDDTYEPANWKLAVNNLNFRLSIARGIDRIKAESAYGSSNPEANLIHTVTPEGFVNVNGTDYTQLGDLAAVSNTDPFNTDEALSYKQKAIEELTAEGVTFPVKILMPYNPTIPYEGECCQIVQQQLEGLLGSDYIDITVEAGPSTNYLSEIRRSGKYGLMLCNWGPDYADPETYSDPWSLGYTYNWPELCTDPATLTGKTYTDADMEAGVFDDEKFIGTPETVYINMVQKAKDEKLDIETRYTLFADAEAYLVNEAFAIPFHRQMEDGYVVSKLSVFDGCYSPFGVSNYKYEGLHLLDQPITTDEFYQQEQQWEKDRQSALTSAAASASPETSAAATASPAASK